MPQSFNGFSQPTSNTTYTPNQFFDVCLPHQSRGVVRLVGYMIRKTLGWSDAHGNPQHETVSFSYNELERKAGVSHSMIRLALDQAVAAGFICCVQKGQAKARSTTGQTATYELRWDDRGQYVKDPKAFAGFFAGEGNRTYIPNQFFDVLVPKEPLATVQVVGAVVRFSIGFVNKYGHRRQRVALSYRDIQRYAKIRSPRVLTKAIREAIARNYVERVEAGYFDPNGGVLSRSAHYAVKWVSLSLGSPITPKSEAAGNHTEKVSGITPKSEAADHSEKVSGIQITIENNNLKQQRAGDAASFENGNTEENASRSAAADKLREQGFDAETSNYLASRYSIERILRQVDWIGQRGAKRNRLGLLRVAIERDWPKPDAAKLGRPNFMNHRQKEIDEARHRLSERFNAFKS